MAVVKRPVPADCEDWGTLSTRVPLTPRHEGSSMWAKIDLRDQELVQRFGPWHILGEMPNRYAETVFETNGHRLYLPMHYLLLTPPPKPGLRVDHRNGNGLDNRRANLRWATQTQILAKRKPVGGASPFKGVGWDREQGKWMATFRGKKVGRFSTEEEAARAFDRAAYDYWGEDCYLNFPGEQKGTGGNRGEQ